MPKPAIDEYLAPWWDETRVMAHLHLDEASIATLRDMRHIVGIQFSDGKHYYPARQFDAAAPTGIVPGLHAVLDALHVGIDDPETWAVWLAGIFEPDLSIYDAMRTGHLDDVVRAARRDARMWRS